MTSFISRDDAVKKLADHLADRDSFVITVSPEYYGPVVRRLDCLPAWVAYIDNGTDFVARTSDQANLIALDILSGLLPFVAILTVPKTVPAKKLKAVVGQKIPADGSRDILCLNNDKPPYHWPRLFVDAMEIVDPKSATAIRASALPSLN